ncbi:MAG: Ppx/GppA family phosphatase [Armatimonadota bacterium]
MREATVAAVDIGTNSVKMSVARAGVVMAERTVVTRLGEGVSSTGRLSEDAMARTLGALGAFADEARELGVVRTAAVATSAVRDAANGADFAAAAGRVLGGPVETISGLREATLVHRAAFSDPDLRLPDGARLVAVDVGGGSTEIVVGGTDGIEHARSLQMGAVRLSEAAGLLGPDPIDPAALARAAGLVDIALAGFPVPAGPAVLSASGGTAANLAGIELGVLDPARMHGHRMAIAGIEARINQLAALPLVDRRRVPGLEPDRADVIVAGAIVLARCARWFDCSVVRASLRGVRHGLLAELAD